MKNIWKILIGVIPIRFRTYHHGDACRCEGTRKHLQNYCAGLAMASAIGALSGTISWSWALFTHAVAIAIYWLLPSHRECNNCEVDDVEPAEVD